MYSEIYQEPRGLMSATGGQWRWRLRAANSEIIASGESYRNKQDCLAAIALVKNTNSQTPVRGGDRVQLTQAFAEPSSSLYEPDILDTGC